MSSPQIVDLSTLPTPLSVHAQNLVIKVQRLGEAEGLSDADALIRLAAEGDMDLHQVQDEQRLFEAQR